MQQDLSDITVVLDRSGSMESCRSDAEGGLNAFIETQKAQPGRARFTLVQFDHLYEVVHNGIPIADVPRCELVPRGNTALYDAIGRTINEIGARLAALPEVERPGLVCVVILTDGLNNASREFSSDQVKKMIGHQQAAYKWQFTYLGANQDAFVVADAIGVNRVSAANYTPGTSKEAFAGAANNVARMRSASAGGQSVSNRYTEDEVKAMAEDPDGSK